MAVLGKWSGGVDADLDTPATWAEATTLFPTEDRNDGSVYGKTNATITLPASGLADGYLFIGAYEFEDTSNGRHNPQARFIQASGTGTFVAGPTGGYSRDNSEDRAYVRCWAFVDGPSASSTYTFQWQRDTDAPGTGDGTVRSELQVIPFYYSDIGLYTSTDATPAGSTTPTIVPGFTGTDGTNITIASNVISCTGDNKRYLVLASQYWEGLGGGARTQRWHSLGIDGTEEPAAKAYSYYRNAANDESGDMFTWMFETVTATVTVEMLEGRGAGVSALQGGADVAGATTSTAGSHTMVVMELNDAAEVFLSRDNTQSALLATTGPIDLQANTVTDFNDTASFTDLVDSSINCVQTADYLFGANISAASNAVANTTRWTAYAEFTINGTEDADSVAGDYMRNNQGTQDTFGWSANLLGFQALTAGDDVGVSVTELAGSEGGGAAVSPAGWTGFWGVNLDTLEAAADTEITTNAPDALTLTEYQAFAQVAPRVWLNTTETKSGATEMTVTSWNTAGTSITFTDPSGSPTGSLKLGVEETSTGDLGWIDVTVNTSDVEVSAQVDALTLAEYAASIDLDITTNVDALTLTENTASVDRDITTSVDALTLTEPQSTITYDVDVQAAVDALTLTENAAAIDRDITAGTDVLSLAEFQATVANDTEISASTDALVLAEFQATVANDTEISAGVDALTLTEPQATVELGVNVEASVDALVLTENQSTITYDVDVQAAVDALVLTEPQATVSNDTEISAGVDALTLAEFAATVANDTEISAGVDTLTLATFSATIVYDVDVQASTDALTLTENAAAVDRDITANTDALTLAEFAATIANDTEVSAGVHALTLTGLQASLGTDTVVSATTDTLTLSTLQAILTYDVDVQAGVDPLTLTEYTSTVDLSGAPVATGTTNRHKRFIGMMRGLR